MDGDAKLESLTDRGCLDARPDAAPERGIEQNHIDGRIESVGGELLEIHHYGIGGERNPDRLADAAHSV